MKLQHVLATLVAIISCAVSPTLADAASLPGSASGDLTAHLRADLGVTLVGGGVSVWADQSGNGNDATQGVPVWRPILAPTGLGGQPAIRFGGFDQHVNLPSPLDLGILNSEYEMFFVSRSFNGGIQFLSASGAGDIGHYEVHLNGGVGARFIPITPNAGDFADIGVPGAYTEGSGHIFNPRVENSGAGIITVDKVQSADTVAAAKSTSNTLLTLGVRGDLSFDLVGDIAEVLVYDRALTSGERGQVENYLVERYSAASPSLSLAETGGTFDPKLNLAPKGTAFAKDLIAGGGFPAHAIEHLNDELYGNDYSWIGDTDGSFAGIALDGPSRIEGIAFGRDNSNPATQFARSIGNYELQYTTDAVVTVDANGILTSVNNWQTIGELDYTGIIPDFSNPHVRHQWNFAPIGDVTGVRIITTHALGDTLLAIDEIEVIAAVPEPASLLLVGSAIAGLALVRTRRRNRS